MAKEETTPGPDVAPAPPPAPAPAPPPAPTRAEKTAAPAEDVEEETLHIHEWALAHLTTGEHDLMRAWTYLEERAGHVVDTAAAFQESYSAFCAAPA